MQYIERLKQYKHKETYLELEEGFKVLIITIKYKESRETQIKIEVNKDDEKTLEMICGVLLYYEFSEHKNINSMVELKNFMDKECYYLSFKNNTCIFAKNFMNGAVKTYTKQEIESIHKININVV